ncbi:RING-H2 finger protein ATL22-like [Diospyros lotus]|uniref:RING-H2 finger protein ATL22-like n=1 Tax=Diospyros lotus TaxID=55363 RepID=UPI002251EDB9|nr:RING-H2 finger protein ATL22-like [Diospyros lotus]
MGALSWMTSIFNRSHDQAEEEEADYSRPSASLVPLPVHMTVESIKEQLPLMDKKLLPREARAICLRICLNGSEEVTQLPNCHHMFHRECIGGWIDQGRVSCPLCRSKLLRAEQINGKLKLGGADPWRRERMIYLFGQDTVFSNIVSLT